MTFLNRKEEVLDIELTQFGKHLLSKGRFKPSYYAFFDDDVLYDAKFAGITTETQNQIEPRIKETPRLRTQYVFRGIESEITKGLQDIRINALQDDSLDRNAPVLTTIQSEADKHYSNSIPLGSAKIGSNKSPSWKVHFLKGELSGSVEIQTNTKQPSQNIPQLDTELLYETSVRTDNFLDGAALTEHPSDTFEDGTYIHLEEGFIMLEVEEINGLQLNSEFEIEVFKIEDEQVDGELTGKEILIPLKFQKSSRRDYEITSNNIFVPRPRLEAPPPANRMNAEYYLDMDLDSEIDPLVMCAVNPVDKTKGIFSSRLHDCADALPEKERANIYSPDEEYEDPCED